MKRTDIAAGVDACARELAVQSNSATTVSSAVRRSVLDIYESLRYLHAERGDESLAAVLRLRLVFFLVHAICHHVRQRSGDDRADAQELAANVMQDLKMSNARVILLDHVIGVEQDACAASGPAAALKRSQKILFRAVQLADAAGVRLQQGRPKTDIELAFLRRGCCVR